MLTVERLREVLSYDPETGVLTWRVATGRRARVGAQAGNADKQGRRTVRIDGVLYQANRLVWLHVTGFWPVGVVDHKDLNAANDAWANLRDVTRLVNQQNRKVAQANNQSAGLLGVTFDKRRGRFMAQIKSPTRASKFIGYFDTPELAHSAYVAEKRKFHEGCTL